MTIRVVQITDIHLLAAPEAALYGVDTALTLKSVVDEVRQLSVQPDLIIATGDLAEDGSRASYERLLAILADVNVPVYVLPGNHDDVSEMRSCLRSGALFFTDATEAGDWGFVFGNSQVEGHSHGCVAPKELGRIEDSISGFGARPVLVALHHTPSNVCPSSGCKLENAEAFTALLNRHSNVKAVIAGHTHTASEVDAGGHVQFTTPSTFAHVSHAQPGESVDHEDFWASHSFDGAKQGFRILDLASNGTLRSEVRWLGG